MEKVIISVIVPVYNCYFYLEECLKSIVKQNFKLFELIIVNDCSEDDSKEIIDFYEKKYDNIKAIHLNKNRGVSYARNTGLNIAQGEFVVFLDADDKITPNMLSYMYNCIKKYNCDLVVCNVLRIEGKNRKTQTHSIGSYSMIITSENIKDYIINSMKSIKNIIMYGDVDYTDDRIGVIPFNIKNRDYSEVSIKMATENAISLRSGKFCAHTYVYRLLGVSDSDAYRDVISGEYFYGMIRASLGLYNTKDEADIFLNELDQISNSRNSRRVRKHIGRIRF